MHVRMSYMYVLIKELTYLLTYLHASQSRPVVPPCPIEAGINRPSIPQCPPVCLSVCLSLFLILSRSLDDDMRASRRFRVSNAFDRGQHGTLCPRLNAI